MKYAVGTIHKTNMRDEYEVIEYESASRITIRFTATGYIRTAETGMLNFGSIKDRLKPLVFGVGFLGVGKHGYKKDRVIHAKWRTMLSHVYGENHSMKIIKHNRVMYEPWHNFQTFCDWYYANGGNNRSRLVHNNKSIFYGPITYKVINK